MASFGYKPTTSMRDPSEQTNPMDEWARSDQRKGWVNGTNPAHLSQIEMITRAVQAGQISPEGAANLSKRVRGLAPYINSALASRESDVTTQKDVQGIVGKYISPGTGGEGDYETPPTDPREDPKGLVRELASNPSLRGVAKDYSELYGLDKAQAQGRGEYYTPVYDKSGRLLSFNARSGEVAEPQMPVVGAKYSPELQGSLAASEAHGKEVGKEISVAGKTVEASDSINSALNILGKGIYAGTYGEAQKFAAKALPGDKQKVANTEEFIAHIGNVVIPRMRDLGGSDTEEELRYMRGITGGDLKMEPESIKRILISAERKIQAKQERLRREAGSVGLGGKVNKSIPPKQQNIQTQKGALTDEQRAALRKRYGL